MKSVMRMFAEQDKGVVFYEIVLSLKPQKHTFIECVPVPWEHFDDLPGYFKVGLGTRYRLLDANQTLAGIDNAIRAGMVST
jgi:hypothetical protein